MRAASAAQAHVQLLSVKIAAEGFLRHWPGAVYLQIDYSDQEHGALVPVAVLDADGQELEVDMELWDELDSGAHVPDLIGNLNDHCGDWSVHRTYANSEAPRQASTRADLKKAAAMTSKEIGSTSGVHDYSPFG